jgi:hypothetical protein
VRLAALVLLPLLSTTLLAQPGAGAGYAESLKSSNPARVPSEAPQPTPVKPPATPPDAQAMAKARAAAEAAKKEAEAKEERKQPHIIREPYRMPERSSGTSVDYVPRQ